MVTQCPAAPLWNTLNEPTFGSRLPLTSARREGDEFSSNECQALLLYLLVNMVWVLESLDFRFPLSFLFQTHSQYHVNKENKPPRALKNEKCQLNPVATLFAGHNLSPKDIFCLKLMRSYIFNNTESCFIEELCYSQLLFLWNNL